jgi:hypothetical protein
MAGAANQIHSLGCVAQARFCGRNGVHATRAAQSHMTIGQSGVFFGPPFRARKQASKAGFDASGRKQF